MPPKKNVKIEEAQDAGKAKDVENQLREEIAERVLAVNTLKEAVNRYSAVTLIWTEAFFRNKIVRRLCTKATTEYWMEQKT